VPGCHAAYVETVLGAPVSMHRIYQSGRARVCLNRSVIRAALLGLCFTSVGCTAQGPVPTTNVTTDRILIGAAAPTAMVDAAPDGSWVAICQARRDTNHDGRLAIMPDGNGTRGDAQAPYLVVGGGEGVEFEDIIATDPTHRRLGIARDGHILIEQFSLGREVDLTVLGAEPPVRFSLDGERVAYKQHQPSGDAIVVYELGTTVRHALAVPGVLAGFYFEPGGEWLHADVAAPGTPLEPHNRECTTGFRGDVVGSDVPVTALELGLHGGTWRDVDAIRATFGAALIVAAHDGALEIVRDGVESELVPASCGGWIVGTDPKVGSVYVACTKLGQVRAPVFDYRAHGARAIGVGIVGATTHTAHATRFIADELDDGRRAVIDLHTGTVYPGATNQFGMYFDDRIALVSRDNELVAVSSSPERVLGRIDRQPTLHAGDLMFVAPLVVDLHRVTVLGVAPPHVTVLALATDGRLLVGHSLPSSGGYAMGPLEWVSAW